ncbi:tigger transposable element-derived protein 4-like, partial [Daktulosphaira vitifoliae]|uniref:tigger transposable element-derived protein 4-like n=1 Tax=Daktulosphaira vitifoliae TaxID=58002 RepID=UPI0021AA8778
MSLKRKFLSISDKKRLIEAVESGKKKKDKEAIFNKTDAEGSRKKNRPSEFPHLEQCLFTWFNQVRQQNIPVSGILIKEKAKSFAEILDISDFTASDGWLSNFKKRHNLVFRKICGESASVDNGI